MSQSRKKRLTRNRTGAVAVGYCHPHEVDAAFHDSVVSLLMYDQHSSKRIVDVIGTLSGPRVASARNQIVNAFLRHPRKPEWLWMVDTDMVFPPDVLDRYLEYANPLDTPILGGLCFIGGGGLGKVKPTLMVLKKSENGDGLKFETVWDYPQDSLVRVDATGAACLLIHRTVLEALEAKYGETSHPWFAESAGKNAEFGEDVTFCMRARQEGFNVSVHTGISIGHVKPLIVDQDTYLEYRRGITAEGEDAYHLRQLERRGTRGTVIQA